MKQTLFEAPMEFNKIKQGKRGIYILFYIDTCKPLFCKTKKISLWNILKILTFTSLEVEEMIGTCIWKKKEGRELAFSSFTFDSYFKKIVTRMKSLNRHQIRGKTK